MELIPLMQIAVELAGVTCKFIYHVLDTVGSCWHWKLDPYKLSDIRECDLLVNLTAKDSDKEDFFGENCLVFTQSTGFFQHQIFYHQDNKTIWKYIRNRSEKLYLNYTINPEWNQISLLDDNTQSAGFLAFEYIGQIIPGVLLKHNILTFHGVLMEYHGQGIIISAKSGTGKTTHARLWRDFNQALIINGDRSTVCIKNGVWMGFGLPWSGTSGEQINRSVPVKALVVLERSEQNEAHCITGLEAFGAVFPHLQYPIWDKKMAIQAISNLEQFLSVIPIIRLSCRPDLEGVSVLKKVLEKL